MRFERLHLLCTYLLVGTGFLVLLLSQEMPLLFWALSVPALVLSWPLGGRPGLSSVPLWNTILVISLVAMGLSAVATGEWLHHALYFTTVMVVAKLFQRQRARDIFQLYALSFLQLVGGAVINPTLSFAFCFVLYVVFLTWALVMLHLRRDLENLYDLAPMEKGSHQAASERVRRLISPGFLAGTSMLALGIFFSSIIVFLMFPRLGLGFFGHDARRGTTVSGFSDTIELGHFGKLKQDQTIIMRVELPNDKALDVLPLRLKGISFDLYDGRNWTKSNLRYAQLHTLVDGYWRIPDTHKVPQSGKLLQRIYLEQLNMERRTVFGEPRMRGVRDQMNQRFIANYRKHTRFFHDWDLDVSYSKGTGGPLKYEVWSHRIVRDPLELRAAEDPYPHFVERYLQLPPLNPVMRGLAEQITLGKNNRYDKVAAIEKYLMREYKYSLEGGHNPSDPLSDFLFGRKSGHCEYFSTALVVLARTLGIVARPASGFFGGAYNDVGDYIAVRQADAHSWAEVFFPGYGWITFDATPPGEVLVGASTGLWASIGRYFDSMELLWYKWVVRWDMERQLEFFKGIGQHIPGIQDLIAKSRHERRKIFRKIWRQITWENTGLLFGAMVLLVLLGMVTRAWIRRYKAARKKRAPEVRNDKDALTLRRLYRRLLRSLNRKGVSVTPATTPEDIHGALYKRDPTLAEQATPILRCYDDVVFGRADLPPEQLADCRRRVSALRRAL